MREYDDRERERERKGRERGPFNLSKAHRLLTRVVFSSCDSNKGLCYRHRLLLPILCSSSQGSFGIYAFYTVCSVLFQLFFNGGETFWCQCCVSFIIVSNKISWNKPIIDRKINKYSVKNQSQVNDKTYERPFRFLSAASSLCLCSISIFSFVASEYSFLSKF